MTVDTNQPEPDQAPEAPATPVVNGQASPAESSIQSRFRSLGKKGPLLAFVLVFAAIGAYLGIKSFADATSLAVDVKVSLHQSADQATITSAKFTTTAPNELLLAFIGSNGKSTPAQTFTKVSGGGLTWSLRARSNTQHGTAEIWQATAPGIVSNATVTATRAYGQYAGDITIVSFTGADLTANGAMAANAATSGGPTVSLTTTRDNSWVWATGNDWDRSQARTVGAGQTLIDQYLYKGEDTTYWTQNKTTYADPSGTKVTINDTAPTNDRWNLAAVEVVANKTTTTTDTAAPTVPAAVNATAVDATHVNLSWTPSTDNVGVSGYNVYRGATKIGTTVTPAYSDSGLTASTAYTYTVSAYDAAGNTSTQSTPPASVTTLATSCPAGQTGTPPNCSTTPPPPPPPPAVSSLTPGTSWQWQIDGGTINETVLDGVTNTKKMYDVDMENTDAATIARLKAKGIYVVCYMETGAWESYRSDAAAFPASVLGKAMNGYPNEKWTDIRQASVLTPIMSARMDSGKAKGCQGLEPDLDDSYTENTGFPLTMQDQLNYNTAMVNLAHSKGMSMGLKNGPGIATAMAPIADWALNEECNKFAECDGYPAFIKLNKAVFNVEYTVPDGMTTAKFCPQDNAANFDGLLKYSSETLAALPRTACRFE